MKGNFVAKYSRRVLQAKVEPSKRDKLKDMAMYRVELENALDSEISPLKDEFEFNSKGEEQC